MDALRSIQHEFLGYLLDDSGTSIVARIESTPQASAELRMALYSNAYKLRLKEALATDYERLHAYLGDELFDSLMQHYINAYPSHYTSLRYFGQHMTELAEQLEVFSSFPEVAEIARIEQAFADSFDAANCTCVSVEQLSALDPAAWAGLRFRFQDAAQLLPLRYNSFQIWRALSADETPPDRIAEDSTWLIWRRDLVSRYRALDRPELDALSIAMSDGNFADVCEQLLHYFDEQETPQMAVRYLQQWIDDQMVCSLLPSAA